MSRLILVPTPIGNLGDITLRAIEVLKTADLILSEDTRKSGILLKHFDIRTPLQSYHDHSSSNKLGRVIDNLKSEKTIAYITDAGTPAISDPGFVLVREAIRNDIPVEVLPGASAVMPAVVLSGLPCERFCFEGFLPQKAGKRKKILESYEKDKRTLVFFESPYKLLAHLEEVRAVLGDRKAAVVRELSKKFEEVVRGSLGEVIENFSKRRIKGEIVVIVEGNSPR